MATSSEVAALANGIADKTAYRGNVQVIPVTIPTVAASTTYDVSVTLPQKTVVVGVNLDSEAQGGGTVSLGVPGTVDKVMDAQDVGSISVGGEILQLVVSAGAAGGSISGYILIATQE